MRCPRCGGVAKNVHVETRNSVADLGSARHSGQAASQAFRGGHPAVGLAHIGYQVAKWGVRMGLKAVRDHYRWECTRCHKFFSSSAGLDD